MPIPTAREINPIPEDLDGKVAEENFLGKSLDDAVLLFKENSIVGQAVPDGSSVLVRHSLTYATPVVTFGLAAQQLLG